GDRGYTTIYDPHQSGRKSAGELLKSFIQRSRYDPAREPGPRRTLTEEEKTVARAKFTSDILPREPAIGPESTGFVARSHSHLDPGVAVITSCVGLPTKLVKNPDEICIHTFQEPMGFRFPISTGSDYQGMSSEYVQRTMDVFDLEQGRVRTIERGSGGRHGGDLGHWDGIQMPGGIDERCWRIMEACQYFATKLGVPVEIEGLVDHRPVGTNVSLFQLTKSHLLESVLTQVEANPSQCLLYEQHGAIGSIAFTGDVILYADNGIRGESGERRLRELLAQTQGKDVLLVTRSFRDDLIAEGLRNYATFDKVEGIVGEHIRKSFVGWTAVHAIGYMTSQLHRRRREGHNVCCVMSESSLGRAMVDLPKDTDRIVYDQKNQIVLLRNARVEAARGEFQIYLVK
ncbi:MAG: hypothetical protein Q7S65_00890, partial [Nanoarchaeota archaeon]|nr:hypothetical protein [Nanoarchaeota archaeon]